MLSYLKSIGWLNGTYKTAIGIRSDEQPRLRTDAEKVGIIYPLAHLFPVDKTDINDWWETQNFTLNLKEHEGNCSWCWKKSTSKHFRLIEENPNIYNFPKRMELHYGSAGTNPVGTPDRVFFRKNQSTVMLFALKQEVSPSSNYFKESPDDGAGCSESCDINMEILIS